MFCFIHSFYNNSLGASGREALKAAAKLTDIQIGYVNLTKFNYNHVAKHSDNQASSSMFIASNSFLSCIQSYK